MSKKELHKPIKKVSPLLEQQRIPLMTELGPSAFDLLTPHEVATALDIDAKLIPDLIRQTWLEGAPNKDIGSAHQYFRWRVEFVKRNRKRYKDREKDPNLANRTDMVNIGT